MIVDIVGDEIEDFTLPPGAGLHEESLKGKRGKVKEGKVRRIALLSPFPLFPFFTFPLFNLL